MSTNKSRLSVTLAWPALLLSAVFFAGAKVDQHAGCCPRVDDARYAAEDRCLEIISTLVAKSLGISFLGITFWAGYARQRPTFPNVSLAFLGDPSWNDFNDNAANLDGTANTPSPSLESDVKPRTAPARTANDVSSISRAPSTREDSDGSPRTEVELG